MSNTDFRIQIAFFSHFKKRKLEKSLGAKGVLSLIELWAFTAGNKPDGNLIGMSVEDIEVASGWDGEPGKLVDELKRIKFLDVDKNGHLSVNDWNSHNPYAAHSHERSRQSAKGAATRDGTRMGLEGEELESFIEKRLSEFDIRSCTRYVTDDVRDTNSLCPAPAPAPAPAPNP